ncbi:MULTISPECIES: sigma-70 family RNA polymerase sigma factor [Ramlibacter]|uniref:Sigma-70 family RNA polymerase sigma factor n=1 Tax=Ramlibacter pinisoli TaxID=2682844 RepID=A0A6N8ISB9_9BURK|nr:MULTISPECIES: sigma-70 family RNA polymerase sigma factor [Ramlibacter]MBA2964772.1 sigma-70 family RNA polymerase sigma factor [Ramlibacter sp. CGMCC 1.13660]MVQ29737.1 sigma-70 family RNA polymerase sigma factor [Ramlibacter pinisoli]
MEQASQARPSTALPLEEAQLWRRFRTGGDEAARGALLDLHLDYSRVLAATYYARRFHDDIEFGDYLQYAQIGLLEAMDRFDPDQGAQFRTFAARRMHGAILNGIERLTEKQQQIAARQRLRAEHAQAVKAAALADSGAADHAALRRPEQLLRYVAEVGIGLALAWLLEGTAMVDTGEGTVTAPFYRQAELRQMRQRLHALVEALPPAEKTVVRSHYLQEQRFDQIAATLGLTKGRISQIHKQAMQRLRAGLAEAGLDLSC